MEDQEPPGGSGAGSGCALASGYCSPCLYWPRWPWRASPAVPLYAPLYPGLVVAWLLNPLVRGIQRRLGISRKFLSPGAHSSDPCGGGGRTGGLLSGTSPRRLSPLYEDWSSISTQCFRRRSPPLDHAFSRFMSPDSGRYPYRQRRLSGEPLYLAPGAVTTALGSSAAYATRIATQVPLLCSGHCGLLMGSYYLTADYPHIRYLVSKRFYRPFPATFAGGAAGRPLAFGGYVKAEFILSVGVFSSCWRALPSLTALYAAAGLSSGHYGLYPYHRRGHRHGALGGGGPGPGESPGVH